MDNASTNENCSNGDWDSTFSVTVAEVVLECVIMSASVILNIFLLATICCSRHLRTGTHIFVASLAASDILTSMYGLCQLTINAIANGRCFALTSRHYIDTGLYMSYVVNTLSGYLNFLIVSGERWLFISRPFLHQRLISPRVTFVGVAVAWAIALLVNLDGFIFSLDYYWTIANIKADIVFPCIHFVGTVVLFPIYMHLTMIARKQMQAINKTRYLRPTNDDEAKNVRLTDTTRKLLRANLRSVRLLVTVFGGFVVLLSPGIYYHFYVRFSQDKQKHPHTHEAFKLLTYGHASVNFIVFASLDRCFRRVLMNWLRAATCRHAKCFALVRDTTSVCRRCRGRCKVNIDDGNSKIPNVTFMQEYDRGVSEVSSQM